MSKVGRRRKAEAGFTLVEMIIVVAIIAVLSAILSLSIRQIRASFALTRAASIAVSEVRWAQAGTIAEAADYTVEFADPGSIYTYKDANGDQSYTSDACVAKDEQGSCIETVDETAPVRQVSGDNWPPSVEITGGSLPNCEDVGVGTSGNLCVRFGFLGAPTAGGDVLLESTVLDRKVRITVQPATGRVSASDPF